MVHGMAMAFIWVRSVEAALPFYRDVLGLKVVGVWGEWAALSAGGQKIGLHGGREGDVPVTSTTLVFAVANLEDAQARLEREGRPTEIHDTPSGPVLAFTDPDGNPLQLVVG